MSVSRVRENLTHGWTGRGWKRIGTYGDGLSPRRETPGTRQPGLPDNNPTPRQPFTLEERNVMGHLPDAEHPWVRTKLRTAWTNPDPDTATAELEALARALQRQHPGAASSLREGLHETLTVTRLGIDGALLKTVSSTNPVESMIEIVREHSSNVKRWRDGEMTLRWAAAGMESARSQFRRVKGYRQLPQLAAALETATIDEPGLLDLRVTA